MQYYSLAMRRCLFTKKLGLTWTLRHETPSHNNYSLSVTALPSVVSRETGEQRDKRFASLSMQALAVSMQLIHS